MSELINIVTTQHPQGMSSYLTVVRQQYFEFKRYYLWFVMCLVSLFERPSALREGGYCVLWLYSCTTLFLL